MVDANLLLIRMCGVIIPRSLVEPVINAIFDAIQLSPVRLLSSATIYIRYSLYL